MRALRVGTLNIWNRCGPWEQRLHAIRRSVGELDLDVLGLQEVLRTAEGAEGPDQAGEIAQGYGYEVAFGTTRDEPIRLGNAVLSRWPIVRAQTWPLPNGGTSERRSLLFAEIDAPCGRLPFFVTHLNWKLHEGHVREEQVRFLADRVREVPFEGFPPIVVGDFNAEPDSDEIRFLRGYCSLGAPKRIYLADCFAVAGEGQGITFSPRTNPFAAETNEPERRIDYVFVRGPDSRVRGKPLSARVAFDRAIGGMFPSDHYGVVAEISTGSS
ncbi:MAG: endonuclease/exonuclease/phosphatase family protein [Deltaproteobacteria bacterium]|nr:endonuclease/exonuclease/phosphatase family protein [Deltaproteobacteria bacterium]